ncbi:hypothetical protein BDN70DRAFT_882497 [Pholiota conissans]|uniref:Uncharacterized protein n=1 Tax=Pholiota conissans TaxID=109636 RepID=A0A9P5YWF3_9AGAR|nr:hypothetical protein BDN70DRAFT_882497 [Pholiota conissans]
MQPEALILPTSHITHHHRHWPHSRTEDAELTEHAMINAGQAIVCSAILDEQSKQDVMNSILFAQLAASAQYDRCSQPKDWYQFYTNILGNVGWVTTQHNIEDIVLDKDQPVRVDQFIIDYLNDKMDAVQLASMKRLITALQNVHDLSVKLFCSSAATDHQANFQLGACTQDTNKNVTISFGSICYTTTTTIENPLFATILHGKCGIASFQSMTLNEQIYGRVRDTIVQKLGQHAEKLTRDLILPSDT